MSNSVCIPSTSNRAKTRVIVLHKKQIYKTDGVHSQIYIYSPMLNILAVLEDKNSRGINVYISILFFVSQSVIPSLCQTTVSAIFCLTCQLSAFFPLDRHPSIDIFLDLPQNLIHP